MDFLSDQLFDGSKIRILTIVDAFSKLSPAIDVRQRYRGADVVETLERVTVICGVANSIRADQGPEFNSKDLDLWAWSKGVTLDFSRSGKPPDNAFVNSFNGKLRAECIDQNWFLIARRCQIQLRSSSERIQRPATAQLNRPLDNDQI